MVDLLSAGLISATVLVWAAMGGLIAERAGVLTIGLESYMLAGAFGAAVGADNGGVVVGVLCGIAAGALVAGVFAVLSVRLRVNQVVAGLAMTLVVLGATSFLNQVVFGETSIGQILPGIDPLAIPLLSDIPVLGPVLFDQNVLTYAAYLLVPVVAVIVGRSYTGLQLSAVGEFPAAAWSRGISVLRVRYVAVLVSGALAGVGGSLLVLGELNSFSANATAGQGFIALAAVIFGGWRPLWAAAACLLFGIAEASGVWANVLDLSVPPEILGMLPYVVTIVALAIVGARNRAPAALGVPYVPERR